MPTVNRALQNPGLFTSDHYRQAALAVAAGVAIRILVSIPVCVPHLNPAIRCENPDGHRYSQELAHQKAEDTLPRSLNMSKDVLMMSSLQYRGFILSPRSTANHVPVDCGREGATMDNLIVCGHEQCHLG